MRAVVLSDCWYAKRNLRAGDVITVDDDTVLPRYLKELEEEKPVEEQVKTPDPMASLKKNTTRAQELELAVESLDVNDKTLWSYRTGRPKVEAVNRVLVELGAQMTTSAELQIVDFINRKITGS